MARTDLRRSRVFENRISQLHHQSLSFAARRSASQGSLKIKDKLALNLKKRAATGKNHSLGVRRSAATASLAFQPAVGIQNLLENSVSIQQFATISLFHTPADFGAKFFENSSQERSDFSSQAELRHRLGHTEAKFYLLETKDQIGFEFARMRSSAAYPTRRGEASTGGVSALCPDPFKCWCVNSASSAIERSRCCCPISASSLSNGMCAW